MTTQNQSPSQTLNPRSREPTRSTVFVFCAVAIVLAFAFLGSRALWSPDEGRYSAVAMEMLSASDWLHPRLHFETYHYTKPPLTYWSIATSIAAFGENEWAARLPNALAFLATIFFVYRIARRLVPNMPLLAALIYATSLLPFVGSNIVTTDTLLAFTTTLSAWGFVQTRAAGRASRWAWLMWFGAALGFLTKGPPALLPLAGLLIAAWRERDGALRRYFPLAGLALFIVIGFSWYAIVVWQDPRLLTHFLRDEVVGRVASPSFHRNGEWYGGFVVYLPTLLIGFLPWWPWAAWRERWALIPSQWSRWSLDARLLVAWIVLPLIVFMIARSRLPLYLLPLAAPLSIAAARAISSAPIPRWTMAAVAVWVIALVAMRGVAAHIDRPEDDKALAKSVREIVHAPISEVVFIESEPRYGLRMYLDASIERLQLDSDENESGVDDVSEELAENETDRYFMIETKTAKRLETEMAALDHVTCQRLGEARGYVIYRIERSG